MSKIIKNFSEFENTNEDFSLGSLFGSLGQAGADIIKSKAIEYFYGYLGVSPESLIGKVISKVAQTIDFSEYWDMISGGEMIPADELAPKLADATMELLVDPGIDGIVSSVNSSLDKSGLIYRFLKELLVNQTRKEDFRKDLINIWSSILGSVNSGGSSASTNRFGYSDRNPLNFSSSELKTLAKDPAVKREGYNVTDLTNSLMGGNPSTGTTQG